MPKAKGLLPLVIGHGNSTSCPASPPASRITATPATSNTRRSVARPTHLRPRPRLRSPQRSRPIAPRSPPRPPRRQTPNPTTPGRQKHPESPRTEHRRTDSRPKDRQRPGRDRLLVDLFLEAFPPPPRQTVLDLDATDLPLPGHPEQRFYHGYYDGYCYLPLYIFCGEHVLCARLRPANQDAAAGCVEEVQRLVAQIRQACPKVQVILRGDSGSCRDALMSWCESNRVDYVLGLARNSRLEGSIAPWLASGSGPTRSCLAMAKGEKQFF
ncbi:MAG: transposase [bacterium]